MANQSPIPLHDPVVESNEKTPPALKKIFSTLFMTDAWVKWFNSLTTTIQSTPVRLSAQTLTAQTASIASTSVPTGSIAAGLYRLSYYFRITTPASVSSSLIVGFTWTDGGVTCNFASAAVTGNTTSTTGTGTLLVNVDQAAPLTYNTTYVSVGTAMAYSLSIVLEEINT